MIRRIALLAAATLLLVACGTDDQTGRFDATVGDVRTAVAAGDRDRAFTHIEELGLLGMEAHADGALDDAELAELGGLLDQARHLVATELPEPTPTTEAPAPEPASAPVPAVAADDDGDDDDDDKKKKKRGKGNNKDKDD